MARRYCTLHKPRDRFLTVFVQSKRVRPAIVLLMSRACAHGAEPNAEQQRLAEITEVTSRAFLIAVPNQVCSRCTTLQVYYMMTSSTLTARLAVLLRMLTSVTNRSGWCVASGCWVTQATRWLCSVAISYSRGHQSNWLDYPTLR